MKNYERPIVVFDSGLGGISVLKKLIEVMPNESFIYYGDSANAPYGPRTSQDVCRLTVEGVAHMDTLRPKAIVIACNTATAAALETLEKRYPHIPVTGIEPAVRRAVQDNPNGRILSLATAGTLASASYRQQLREVSEYGTVISAAAPGIVDYIERGARDREWVIRYLRELLVPWQSISFDGVVLGCTHFPFAAGEIQEALGYKVRFYESSEATAQKTQSRLIEQGTINTEAGHSGITFMNSANDKMMLSRSWKLFAMALNSI